MTRADVALSLVGLLALMIVAFAAWRARPTGTCVICRRPIPGDDDVCNDCWWEAP